MFETPKIIITILIILILAILGYWLYFLLGEKKLQLLFPNGGEILEAGETYTIRWRAKKIDKIGIVLFEGNDVERGKWIVENFPAKEGKYDWKIFVWEKPSDDYKIAIFEYPFTKKGKIDSSDKSFTIVGPQFASCDQLSIAAEWPFLPSDYPNLRKVFITTQRFSGNLDGLNGADIKCQQEAQQRGFEGEWKALLGDDNVSAVERLNLEGIFVEATPIGILPEKKTCYRLLGKDFKSFVEKLSSHFLLNQKRFGDEFLRGLEEVWVGRIDKQSKKECIEIFTPYPSKHSSPEYSFTTTCQNWTSEKKFLSDYSSTEEEPIEPPNCYTPDGRRIKATGIAGFSVGVVKKEDKEFFSYEIGKPCNTLQRLICVQQ